MDPVLVRLLWVTAFVVVVLAAGLVLRRRQGRLRDGDAAVLADVHLERLGLDLRGTSGAAVLVGSPTCGPCVQARRVLGEVAAERTDFRWVYADAEEHPELSREHRVLRVPTVLVVAPSGRIVARSTGVPRSDELHAALSAPAA